MGVLSAWIVASWLIKNGSFIRKFGGGGSDNINLRQESCTNNGNNDDGDDDLDKDYAITLSRPGFWGVFSRRET